jgi:aminoglycoside phosphotransferase (APT) family kinase protein
MTNPWNPDRRLTLEIAQSVIRASLPSVNASSLTFLGSGWEFDAYLTSDGWVVRFPRRQEMAGLFEKDRRVHPLVAQYLPPSVEVPHIELLGQPAAGFPYNIAAHRFIAGVPVDELDERFLRTLAPQLGAALTAIHSVSPVQARESGVPEVVEDDVGARDWFRSGIASLSKLPNPDPIVQGAMRWVEQVSIPDVAFAGPLRFIHQDLSPEHVLANPETGRLTGIIDWTDVMLGDPARDFVCLVAWRGWSFTEEVLRHYSPPPDPGFRDRLRFMARLLTPIWLALAHERGTEVEKMRTWLHNAYAPELHGLGRRSGNRNTAP